MKKYYKIVISSNGSLRSLCGFNLVHNAKPNIKYEIDKWVYPKIKGSKLFVFDNIFHAIDFNDEYNDIFECEVINPTQQYYNLSHIIFDENSKIYNRFIKEFWKIYKNDRNNIEDYNKIMNAPQGTCVCDAVKLIRRIK